MKALAIAALAAITCLPAMARPMSDAEVRQAIILQSQVGYPGNCPCPYNVDRRGHSCGRRSAYSRPGGYAPLCFDSDVTSEMVRRYRVSH